MQPQLREGHVPGKSLAWETPQENERELKAARRKKAPTHQGDEQRRLRKKAEAGRRDLGEWANNCRRMRVLKGRNIGALVDGKRVTVVSGKSEKSRVVPLGKVSRQRVKIPEIRTLGAPRIRPDARRVSKAR